MMIIGSRSTTIFLGTCAPCVRPIRVTDEQARGKSINVTCPECGRRRVAERLYAVTNAAEPCDAGAWVPPARPVRASVEV